MNYLNFDRPNKCFFCEHDRGHLAKTKPQCETCFNFKNFQVKQKMHPRQSYEWQKYKEWEVEQQ